MKKLLAIGIILLFIGMTISSSTGFNLEKQSTIATLGGNTLYVGGSGSGNYTKIQDAIDNASDGDTVFVFNGTYFGHININKSINLIGEDKNTTFITGFLAYTISIVSDWVNISGFTIQNSGRSGEGVRIDSCYNNFINNIIDTPNDNIRVSGDSNTISGNTITNNYHGIYITDSCDNIISNNSFFNSGLFISEDTVWNNIVTNNTVNGKSLVYVYDESDLVLDVDAGQIILVNCTNITVQNQEIFNTTVGIQIWGSNTCVISGNIIAGNHYGICIYSWNNTINDNTITNNYDAIRLSGDNNTISGSTISNNDDGIYLYYSDHNNIINNTITTNNYYSILLDYGSDFNNIINNTITNNYDAIRLSGDNNTISGNTISNNDDGINLFDSNNNIITDNTISNNYWKGIELRKSCNNTIMNNNISNNDWRGIELEDSSNNNIIYHNNLINNAQNAKDGYVNEWDNGYPSGGNYWDDYSGTDEDGDGIGDTPYPIPGGDNQDRYPLMTPFGNQYPVVEIINPKKGYIHFSGIPILPTPFDLIADTMSIGGFRLYPIIINATDDSDNSSDLIVKVFLNGEEQGNASYCCDWRLHEWFWTGWALGTYTLTITAEDSFGAIGSAEMEVWNFCFIP